MPEKKTRRIALVGTAPSRVYAPFTDPSVDIWGVGLRAADVPRADRWFEVHRLDGEPAEWAADWRRLMKAWSHECEIWMFYPEPDLGPRIVHWNPQDLVKKHGTFFMTSSFSWMMALAIEEILEAGDVPNSEILLFGVDMEYGTEYSEQRVGLRHFIDLAKVLGIKVTRLASSGIAYEPVPYPFWMDDPLTAKMQVRKQALEEKRRECMETLRRHEREVDRLAGCIDALNALKVDGEQRQAALDQAAEYARLREQEAAKARSMRDDVAAFDGSLAELAWLKDYLSH